MSLPRSARIATVTLTLLLATTFAHAAETEAPPRTGFDILYQAGIEALATLKTLHSYDH